MLIDATSGVFSRFIRERCKLPDVSRVPQPPQITAFGRHRSARGDSSWSGGINHSLTCAHECHDQFQSRRGGAPPAGPNQTFKEESNQSSRDPIKAWPRCQWGGRPPSSHGRSISQTRKELLLDEEGQEEMRRDEEGLGGTRRVRRDEERRGGMRRDEEG